MGKNFKNDKLRKECVGLEFKNAFGEIYKIIEYKDAHNVTIMFENGYISTGNEMGNIKKGIAKNKYRKYDYGRYVGEDIKHDRQSVQLWSNMFIRCYNESELIKHPNYVGCKVCEEWFCFNDFARWYNKNKWGNNLKLQVDKDILFKRNKIYSPSTCLLVPQRINKLFVHSVDSQTRNGLIGTYLNQNGRYTSQCKTESKTNKNLGSFDSEIEAFLKYKEVRELYIKRMADKHKQKYTDFPQKLYEAMHNYEVEITD